MARFRQTLFFLFLSRRHRNRITCCCWFISGEDEIEIASRRGEEKRNALFFKAIFSVCLLNFLVLERQLFINYVTHANHQSETLITRFFLTYFEYLRVYDSLKNRMVTQFRNVLEISLIKHSQHSFTQNRQSIRYQTQGNTCEARNHPYSFIWSILSITNRRERWKQ